MRIELSLAEMLLNAIVQDRIPGVQIKRRWEDDRATAAGLTVVIGSKLNSAREVAREEGLRQAKEEIGGIRHRGYESGKRHMLEEVLDALSTMTEVGSGQQFADRLKEYFRDKTEEEKATKN